MAPTPDPIQQLLSGAVTFVKNVATDLNTDEKAALKPALSQFFTGLGQNPDIAGLQALVLQLQAAVVAAQVQVKSALLPQVGALGQALIASW